MSMISLPRRQPPRVRRPQLRAAQPGAAEAELGPLPQTWRTSFFEALAETSNVARACQAAGVSPATVYHLKRRDLGFADRWLDALAEGYDNLEMELLDRLRNGESGEVRYNYPVAVRAIQAHRDAVQQQRGRRASHDTGATQDSILRKLQSMREQVLAAAAERRQAATEEPNRSGGAHGG